MFDRGAEAAAGIVDEDVDAAKLLDGGGNQPADIVVASHIGREGEDVGVAGGEFAQGGFGAGGGDDVGAGRGEGQRVFAADAGGGAGNQDGFAGECVCHFSFRQMMI